MFEPVEFLRQQTRVQHQALEAQGVFARIVEADIGLADYERLLTVLGRFYGAVEPDLLRALAGHDCRPLYRPRLTLLAGDLDALGRSLPPAAQIALPMASTAQLLGVIYAIEGSALGGQIIARQLRSKLGGEVDGALGFFEGLAVNIGNHWQSVLGRLRQELRSEGDAEQAVQGARSVFVTLQGL